MRECPPQAPNPGVARTKATLSFPGFRPRCWPLTGAQALQEKTGDEEAKKGDGRPSGSALVGVSFFLMLFLQFPIFLQQTCYSFIIKKKKHCMIFHLLTSSGRKTHTLKSAQLSELSQTEHTHVTNIRWRSRTCPVSPGPLSPSGSLARG